MKRMWRQNRRLLLVACGLLLGGFFLVGQSRHYTAKSSSGEETLLKKKKEPALKKSGEFGNQRSLESKTAIFEKDPKKIAMNQQIQAESHFRKMYAEALAQVGPVTQLEASNLLKDFPADPVVWTGLLLSGKIQISELLSNKQLFENMDDSHFSALVSSNLNAEERKSVMTFWKNVKVDSIELKKFEKIFLLSGDLNQDRADFYGDVDLAQMTSAGPIVKREMLEKYLGRNKDNLDRLAMYEMRSPATLVLDELNRSLNNQQSDMALRLKSDGVFREQFLDTLSELSLNPHASYEDFVRLLGVQSKILNLDGGAESSKDFNDSLQSFKDSSGLMGVMHALPEIRQNLPLHEKNILDSIISEAGQVSAAQWYLSTGRDPSKLKTFFDAAPTLYHAN